MMKTMKKGLLRTVAFTVAWSILWTTVSNSLFTSVSYAAEAEEPAITEEIIEEIPAEAPVEEAPAEEAVIEETPAEEAAQPVEEAVVEEATEQETAEAATEEVPAEETVQPAEEAEAAAEPVEETIHATITYKASEGGKVSVKNETLTWKKITSTDENGAEVVTFEAVATKVNGSVATAEDGYTFKGWTKNGKVVSEEETFVPAAAKADVTYKAEFEVKAVEEKEEAEEKTEEEKDSEEDTAVTEAADEEKAVEEKEEKEESKEDKVSYPAASFTGETGDVSVRAHVKEGVFPEGTTMKVSAVSASEAIAAAQDMVGEGTEVVDAVAADITFRYEGKEIQPEGGVYVRLSTKRTIAGESHEAITIDGSGSASSMGGASAHSASFDTDHFTVYGVVGTEYADEDVEQYIRHRYEFYAGKPGPDGGKKPGEWGWTNVASQIVKDGDTLQFPADPAGDAKYTFAGWYLTNENGEYAEEAPQVVTIDPATMPKENAKAGDADEVQKIVKVYAKFATRYKVTFYAGEKGPADGGVVLKTELKDDGEKVSLLDREAATASGLIPEDGKVLVAWKDADGNEYRIDKSDGKDGEVKVNGADIDLYPVFEDAHNVSFDLVLTEVFPEKIPDQVVENGKTIEDTSGYKKGEVYRFYKFGGWYTDENYHADKEDLDEKYTGNPVDLSAWVLNEDDDKDIILHAKWIPDTVKFTVTPFREAQNEAVYEEIHEDAQEIEWGADEDFPIDKILVAFPGKKYNNINKTNIGVCHYSGTGVLDGEGPNAILENGAVLPAIQVMDKEGNVIATYDAKEGTLSGEVDRDSIGSVRVNYNRDRYHLYFLFTDAAEDKSKSTTLGGYTGSLTMSDAVKSQAPEDYTGDSLPTDIIVKHAQHLYKVTHLVYNYERIFDPFMGTLPWYYERKGMTTSGQAIFDDSNQSFPVRTTQPDGGSVCIQLRTHNTQKKYTYVHCYYEGVSSWDEVKRTSAQPTETLKKEIVYRCDDSANGRTNSGHTHNFDLGTIGKENYIMVAVTGQAAYKLNGRWYGDSEAVWSGGDVQTINVCSVNGYWDGTSDKPGNNSNDPETVYIHFIPKTVTVTFKQTRDGKVGGFDVAADSKETDVKVTNIVSGTDLSAVIAQGDALNWETLTDNRGVEYKALSGWKCVQYPDGIPEKMPAKDLTFYKEWETDRFTVTLDYGYDDIIEDKENIAYGSAVPSPDSDKLVRDDYILTGWKFYERDVDANGNAKKGEELTGISFHSIVTRDLYAEAQWVPDKGFIVEYRAGDHGEFGGQETKKDPAVYRSDSAPVNYMPEPEKDYVFTGYKILGKDGELHDPDDPKTIAYDEDYDLADQNAKVGKIVLVAQYEKAEYETTVIYHANYPGETGDRKVEYDSYVTNNTFTVADITAVGFQSVYVDADGSAWQFDGWSNRKDAHTSGFDASEAFAYFKPGDKTAAGDPGNTKAKGANDLWAVWKVIEEEPEPEEPEPPTPPTPDPEPTPDDPTDIPDDPTPTTDTPDPEPVNPAVSLLENILGVRRTPPTGDDVPAVAGSRRSRVDTNDYSRMEYWMILALGCILIQADMFRKVKKQKATK